MKLPIVLLFIFALILTACASPASPAQTSTIQVTNPWVRTVGGMGGTNAMGGSATALFMTIQNNGEAADTLLKVESDVAEMVQIHLSEIDAKGVSSMHEVDGVEIPAGGTAELKPGGYHVMLMGLKRDIKAGDKVTFTLTFKNAGKISVEAPVKAP